MWQAGHGASQATKITLVVVAVVFVGLLVLGRDNSSDAFLRSQSQANSAGIASVAETGPSLPVKKLPSPPKPFARPSVVPYVAPKHVDQASQPSRRRGPVLDPGAVCIRREDADIALRQSVASAPGLRPWPYAVETAEAVARARQGRGPRDGVGRARESALAVAGVRRDWVAIAYLIQVSVEKKLSLVRRVFNKLYSPDDLFLYLSDYELLDTAIVEAALVGEHGAKLPSNVIIESAPHTDYFYWPRVKVVLDGIAILLQHPQPWDFVVHLSESDYPVHSQAWLRWNLARQRDSNFIGAVPRCSRSTRRLDAVPDVPSAVLPGQEFEVGAGRQEVGIEKDPWYWWTQELPIASCGGEFTPGKVDEAALFPIEDLERRGMIFARSPEWVVLTREVSAYIVGPGVEHFQRLIGMHAGSDEIFWATVVLNIPNFTQKLSNQGWYIKWPQHSTGHSPETLRDTHIAELLRDRDLYLFTRKVDEVKSDIVLRALDAMARDEEPWEEPSSRIELSGADGDGFDTLDPEPTKLPEVNFERQMPLWSIRCQ